MEKKYRHTGKIRRAAMTALTRREDPSSATMKLGQGGNAVVYSLMRGQVALKVFGLQHKLGAALRDVERQIAHEHVVRILGHDASAGWIAMECVLGCSLAQVLERDGLLQGKELVSAILDVLAGLEAFHAHGIPHRDLKPSNVLQEWGSGRCKLVDWIGQAAEDASLLHGKPVGTPVFMAPEVARTPHRHCLASDFWALGCTVVNLASGLLPWANSDAHGRTNEFMAMWNTAHGRAPPYDSSSWAPELKNLVSVCFEEDPLVRTKAQQLRNDLQHVFDKHSGCTMVSAWRSS